MDNTTQILALRRMMDVAGGIPSLIARAEDGEDISNETEALKYEFGSAHFLTVKGNHGKSCLKGDSHVIQRLTF
jgi:hypothetical protein